jgi:hypothetical protein
MKKLFLIMVLILAMGIPAFAGTKTLQPTIGAWDGNDSSGNPEISYPVKIDIFRDGATPTVVSTVSVTGVVMNYAMPTFTVDVPDNTSTKYTFYAVATDASGNASPKSAAVSITLTGKDTIPPGTPVITIIVNP